MTQPTRPVDAGEREQPHHPLCNFFGRNGPCRMCEKFYADPKYADWTHANMDAKIAEHFPEAVKR
jgi:hypothetical protein